MKTFKIVAVIGEEAETFTVKEETTAGSFIINKDQKFVTRVFKDTAGRWKSREVSDLNPADLNTIGEEIDLYLNDLREENL